MRRIAAVASLLISSAVGSAQMPARVFSYGQNPSQESLDRLNLQYAWRLKMPMESHRDGFASIQNIGGQVLVQLRSGLVIVLDAETGETNWTAQIGPRYPAQPMVGFTEDVVFVVDGPRLVALERSNGTQRWDLNLDDVPSAPPTAGLLLLYVPLPGGKVSTYSLPSFTAKALAQDAKGRAKIAETISKIREKIGGAAPVVSTINDSRASIMSTGLGRGNAQPDLRMRQGLNEAVVSDKRFINRNFTRDDVAQAVAKPIFLSTRTPGFRVNHPVQPFPMGVMVTGDGPEVLALRLDPKHAVFEYKCDAPQVAPPVLSKDAVHLTTSDGKIQAISLTNGRVQWRWFGLSRAAETPIIAGDSMYVTTERHGVVRLDLKSGLEVWHNNSARKMLTANDKFVYTTDRLGRLQVLDRVAGEELSMLDLSSFNVTIPNQRTDRLLLAAHDGSIICLRDQDVITPMNVNPQAPLVLPGILDKKPGEGDKPTATPPAAKPPT